MAKKSTCDNSPAVTSKCDGDGQAASNVISKEINLDTCMTVLPGVQEQIRFADAKAAFIFGINTLMFGFVAGSIATLKKALVLASVPAAAWVSLVSVILFGFCVVFAFATLIHAVMSRFGALAPKSRCFFAHIATSYGKDYAKYVTEVRAMTDDDWLGEVGTQIVETSHIAHDKHRAVWIAAIATIVGLASWVVTLFSISLLP